MDSVATVLNELINFTRYIRTRYDSTLLSRSASIHALEAEDAEETIALTFRVNALVVNLSRMFIVINSSDKSKCATLLIIRSISYLRVSFLS